LSDGYQQQYLDEGDGPVIDFKSLVESYQEKVRNTCFRFVNNREDAEDVAQEVFIQVFELLAHFRQEAQISTWIYRIAVNKSLDFIRKKKRKKRFAQIISLFGFGEEKGEIILPANNNPYRELRLDLRSNYLGAFDIVPSVGWYRWGIANATLKRGLSLLNTDWLCRRVNLRFQVESAQLEDFSRLRWVRRDVARILTVLRARQITEEMEAEDE